MRERDDLVFSMEEYRQRLENVRAEMERRGFDLYMIFSPENLYYLTGLNSVGYYTYQCLLLPLNGEPMMLTRHLETANVRYQTWVEQMVDYRDEDDPIVLTKKTVTKLGFATGKIGIELNSWFLTTDSFLQLKMVLPGANFVDGSGIVDNLRIIKSPSEIEFTRKAARVASASMRAAINATRAGVMDNDVAAAALDVRTRAGSEYVAYEPFVVIGPKSGLAHNNWERRVVQQGDVAFYEIGACINRYHAASIRSAVIGEPTDYVRRAADAARAGLEAAVEVMGPGVTAHEADTACRATIAKLGFGKYHHHRLGYHIGIGFPPIWGGRGVFCLNTGVQDRLQPGMIFHLVPTILIPEVGGLGNSETVLITENGIDILTDVELKLFIL